MKKLTMVAAVAAFSAFLIAACAPSEEAADGGEATVGTTEEPNPTKNAYFGDLHVHTRYSFDAFIFGTTTDPNDAYEFAKGGTIKHPAGFDMTLDRPLDFQGRDRPRHVPGDAAGDDGRRFARIRASDRR